ncbi:MAG: hypothetical protein ACP5UQ_14570 [Anaerolineae bacterium]
MRSTADVHVPDGAAKQRILSLLNDLPPEGIAVAEQFVRFLHQVARQGLPVDTTTSQQPDTPVFAYPTIGLSPASLDTWLNLMPEGYVGDALADTEALYADSRHEDRN